MKGFIVRDKNGDLYISLRPFEKFNGDWKGTQFVSVDENEFPSKLLENIKFEDSESTIVNLMFGKPDDYIKVIRHKISDEEIAEIIEQKETEKEEKKGFFDFIKSLF